MIRISLLLVLLASQAVAGEPTIHPKDAILLKADVPKGEDELINTYYHVDDSGNIRLPYFGKVAVGGLTTAEAARLIDDGYISKGVFAHPSVTVTIGDPSVAEVRVGGPVQRAGKYRMKTPATIDQAFAEAGGWSGSGEDGIPAKFCSLSHDVDGETVDTPIRVRVDRKTKQIQVLDPAWKDYHLVSGDRISLAEVMS